MTDRDYQVVEFIDKLPCYSDTIQQMFYPSQRVANRRLAFMYDYLYLRRVRHGANDKYFYFTKREPNFKTHLHYDVMARTYNWIVNNGYLVHSFDVQKQFGNLRPDLLMNIERNGKKGVLAVEVELSNNNVSKKIEKYEHSELRKLLLVSRSNFTSNKIDIIKLNLKELL